jgi:hypothetical protein
MSEQGLFFSLYFTGNSWTCSCDALYNAYKVLREETTKNITLLCTNPEDGRGKPWDILEDKCKPKTAAEITVIADTNRTYEATEIEVTTVEQMVAKDGFDQNPSSEAPSVIPGVIFIVCFAVAACFAVAVVTVVTRRIRKPDLNHLWWEDTVGRRDLMSA